MRVSRRRRRRTLILVGGALGLMLLAVGGYFVRQVVLDSRAQAARTAGLEAYKRGDYKAALDGTGRYLQQFRDTEATSDDFLNYARARLAVPLPNRKHVVNAIGNLRRARELAPQSGEIAKELLDAYLQVGYVAEALKLLDQELASRPGDLEALTTKCDLLAATNRFADALAVSEQHNELAPADVVGHARTLRLKVRDGQPIGAVATWVDGLVVAHADAPQFKLLAAMVAGMRDDAQHATALLDEVVAATTSDAQPDFVRLLVGELDRARRYKDSIKVLERASDSDAGGVGADVCTELLRRLLYARRATEIPEHVARWDASDVTPEARALLILGLRALGDDAAAAKERAALDAATDEASRAWRSFCDAAAPGTDLRLPETLETLIRAVADVPGAALLWQTLGDAWARRGESENALSAWRKAGSLAPSWALPLRRMADAVASSGARSGSIAFAEEAFRRSPRDPDVLTTYVTALAGRAGDLSDDQVGSLLENVERLRTEAPALASATLPAYVMLLRQTDSSRADEVLEDIVTSGVDTSLSVLVKLARSADAAGSSLSGSLLDLAESQHGMAPGLALARSAARGRETGAPAALRLFDEQRTRAKDAATLEWELARATLLELLKRPGAGERWIELADANDERLEPQLGALASRDAWSDREAVDRIIDRVYTLTGEPGLLWRTFRARWLLESPKLDDEVASNAASLLQQVIATAPRDVQARLLLARALEHLRNLPAAEEQLRTALEASGGETRIRLDLVRLAQIQGHNQSARAQLDEILAGRDLPPAQSRQAAYFLAMGGAPGRGAAVLEPLVAASDDRDGTLLLARLYARLGESERAATLVQRLLSRADPDAFALAADLRERLGRPSDADVLLSSLDSLGLAPGQASLIRALHAARWRTDKAARAAFERAIADAGEGVDLVWSAYLSYAIARGDNQALTRVLDDDAAGAIDTVAYLRQHRETVEAGLAADASRALLREVLDSPRDRETLIDAVASLVALDPESRVAPDLVENFQALATATPDSLALQLVAADLTARGGERSAAADIAQRAAEEFPNSAAAASMASRLLAATGRWNDVVSAGRAWRDRVGTHNADAAATIAEALIRDRRPVEALAEFDAQFDTSAATWNEDARLVLLHITALVATGDDSAATDRLGKLIEADDSWRSRLLAVGPDWFPSATRAESWLELCASVIPAGDVPATVRLARAWGVAAQQFDRPAMLARAQEALVELGDPADSDAEVALAAAMLHQQAGDEDDAARMYETALKRDPNSVVAANNLAMILADAGDVNRAETLARRCVEARPDVGEFRDTLAYALRKAGRLRDAVAELDRAIEIDANNPEWPLAAGEILVEVGDVAAARQRVSAVERLLTRRVALTRDQETRIATLRRATR